MPDSILPKMLDVQSGCQAGIHRPEVTADSTHVCLSSTPSHSLAQPKLGLLSYQQRQHKNSALTRDHLDLSCWQCYIPIIFTAL